MKKLLVIALVLFSTSATANPVTDWVNKTWNETVEYQKTAWQNGKEQNAKNWNTIKSFFGKVKENVSQD